jgi:hypothetical protein
MDVPLVGGTFTWSNNWDPPLLLCTITMNNTESKEREQEKIETDLRGSTMCLRPLESGYISLFNDIGLHPYSAPTTGQLY